MAEGLYPYSDALGGNPSNKQIAHTPKQPTLFDQHTDDYGEEK